jgi:hypothetical protein
MSDMGFMIYVMTLLKTLSKLQNNSNHICYSCHSHNVCLTSWKILLNKGGFVVFLSRQPPVRQGLIIHEVYRSHTTTHHSRWDSSRRVISSLHRRIPNNTKDKHPCPRFYSNPQSQQACGRRHTP